MDDYSQCCIISDEALTSIRVTLDDQSIWELLARTVASGVETAVSSSRRKACFCLDELTMSVRSVSLVVGVVGEDRFSHGSESLGARPE